MSEKSIVKTGKKYKHPENRTWQRQIPHFHSSFRLLYHTSSNPAPLDLRPSFVMSIWWLYSFYILPPLDLHDSPTPAGIMALTPALPIMRIIFGCCWLGHLRRSAVLPNPSQSSQNLAIVRSHDRNCCLSKSPRVACANPEGFN